MRVFEIFNPTGKKKFANHMKIGYTIFDFLEDQAEYIGTAYIDIMGFLAVVVSVYSCRRYCR